MTARPPHRSNRSSSPRGGFTIIEAMITLVIFSIMIGGFLMSFLSAGRITRSTEAQYQLLERSERINRDITRELERSGYTTQDGLSYPAIYNGVDDLVAALDAFEGTPGLLYRLPEDGDGDGWPDVTAAGEVVWDPVVYGLVLVEAGDDLFTLERRTSRGERSVLCRNVVDLVFREPADLSFAIPLNAVAVEVEVQHRASFGERLSMASEFVVSLPNGSLSQ